MEEEKTICEITPSQIVNLGTYTISLVAIAVIVTVAILTDTMLLLVLLVLPIGYAFYKWLNTQSTKLKVTDQRLIVQEGIFSKHTHELELYRVRDFLVLEPFFYRLFGCGTIVLHTTDETSEILKLSTYKKPHWLKDQLRHHAEICRQKKRWGTDNILLHDHLND